MIFPNAPAYLTPAARNLIAGRVMRFRRAVIQSRDTLQELLDDVFQVDCMAEAWKAGERAARALQVGDVFPGCIPASESFYGSTLTADSPVRARLEHKAFRDGYLAALPNLWTDRTTGALVTMRRAARRTYGAESGFVVLEQSERGKWRPVMRAGRPLIYATEGEAADKARNMPHTAGEVRTRAPRAGKAA